MNVRIAQVGDNQTLSFAARELARYLKKMDPRSDVALMRMKEWNPERKDLLWLGMGEAFAALLPEVENPAMDDGIYLNVEGGCGVIAGANPRAALIAVYRLLRENGCFFDRPTGEIIPERPAEKLCAHVCEAPDSRYRVMCLEGAVSYDNVRDMIDWLPKVGMNGYYRQFFEPKEFFRRWYRHEGNPLLPAEALADGDATALMAQLEEEIALRGLSYEAVGHGWTSEAIGVSVGGWEITESGVPEEMKPLVAELDGKRELFEGVALNTQLCYSNPLAREKLVSAIVDYCEAHPEVEVVHFWLADAGNNHCECENCQKEIPSDFYVMMLNDLDDRLTAKGIGTKIIFLMYQDILFTPKHERIKHPERFILMFAPITRSYTKPFEPDERYPGVLPEYNRNKVVLPIEVSANLEFLRRWQEIYSGESVDFDYHYMWDHVLDAGYHQMAKILLEDVKRLKTLGMSGFISCQLQRTFFPHSLGMHMMAEGLWNRNTEFEDAAADYFRNAFGEDGVKVEAYMRSLSEALPAAYLRTEMPMVDVALSEQFAKAETLVDEFAPVIGKNWDHPEETIRTSWRHLRIHGELVRLLARAMARHAAGDFEECDKICAELCCVAQENELELQPDLDVMNYVQCMTQALSLRQPVRHWRLRRQPLER